MWRGCLAAFRFAFWVTVIIAGSQTGGTCVAQTGAAALEKGASLHTQIPRFSHWQTDTETDQTLFECTAKTSHLELARDPVEDPSSGNQYDVVLYRMRSAECPDAGLLQKMSEVLVGSSGSTKKEKQKQASKIQGGEQGDAAQSRRDGSFPQQGSLGAVNTFKSYYLQGRRCDELSPQPILPPPPQPSKEVVVESLTQEEEKLLEHLKGPQSLGMEMTDGMRGWWSWCRRNRNIACQKLCRTDTSTGSISWKLKLLPLAKRFKN